MKSATTRRFWACFDALPDHIQRLASESFELWKRNPHHPSLHFKQGQGMEGVYSARVGAH